MTRAAFYPMEAESSCLGVKREIDHTHSLNAKVKNAWSYISIPPYVFMPLCLIKHRDSLLNDLAVCVFLCSP
jgi:hypothetical protein